MGCRRGMEPIRRPFPGRCKMRCTNTRSVRRTPHTHEHMFSSPTTRREGFITVHPALRRAASLARAFIFLEDSEPSGPRTPDGEPQHPHRVPLRSMGGTRRPGAGVPRAAALPDTPHRSNAGAALEALRAGGRSGALRVSVAGLVLVS